MTGAPPLRRARPEDAAAIAGLVNRAYEKYLPRIGRPPAPMLADYPDVIRRHEVWAAEADGAIIAVLVLIPENDVLLIDNIAVDPARQAAGLGRRLMAFAESEAQRQGFAALRLYTNEKMTENIAFYTRLGYRETGRDVLRGLYVVHMRKDLSADA
jgi:ribosomal protein S18 acetylase RimI-like enzyme